MPIAAAETTSNGGATASPAPSVSGRGRHRRELQPRLGAQGLERLRVHTLRRLGRDGEVVDRADAGGAQPGALHRAHAGDEQQVAVRLDLDLAGRAASAGDDLEISAVVAPGERRSCSALVDPPVRDERTQPRPAHVEQRQQVAHGVRPDAAVAEDQVDLIGSRDAETVELVDICRQLHECGDPGRAGELGVLHPPAPVRIAEQEVGEPDELRRAERSLIDHRGVRAQGAFGLGDDRGERLGVGGRHLRQLDHAGTAVGRAAVLREVVREHDLLVHVAHRRRAREGRVLRILDRLDPPELGVQRPRPGELALRGELQVGRAPDHPARPDRIVGGGDHAHGGSCRSRDDRSGRRFDRRRGPRHPLAPGGR